MVAPEQIHNRCGGHLCLDFANSIGRTPDANQNERLVDYSALLLWSVQAGSVSEGDAGALRRLARSEPRAAEAVLSRARVLREAVFRIFLAAARGRQADVADLQVVNTELAKALSNSRVERGSGGYAWTWLASAQSLDSPLWPMVRAAADLLVSPDRERVKECASDACLWLFLDNTRNHARRWCEMGSCGNREKIRRFRRRHRKRTSRRVQ